MRRKILSDEESLVIASDHSRDFKTLMALAKTNSASVAEALIGNPSATFRQGRMDFTLLTELAKKHPDLVFLSGHIQFILMVYDEDDDQYQDYVTTLIEVSQSPALGHDIAEILFAHEDVIIRRSLAENTALTREQYETIFETDDAITRKFLADNKACPDDILQKLSLDKDAMVKNAAKRALRRKQVQ